MKSDKQILQETLWALEQNAHMGRAPGKTRMVLAKMCVLISRQIYYTARIAYRREKGKLPGSERTKRLRKKRMSMVMFWAANQQKVKR